MSHWQYIVLSAAAAGLFSCSSTKYVPEGSYLLDKVEVRNAEPGNAVDVSGMRSYLRQQSNARWFSALKIPLATYSLSGRDSTRWINRVLKSMGEPPVLYDTARTAQSAASLVAKMQSDGYLDATVETSVETKGKKARVSYLVCPREPYVISRVRYEIRDSVIARLLNDEVHFVPSLREGMQMKSSTLDAERERIADALTNIGYYKFNKDFITYTADTTAGSHDVALTLILHKYYTKNIADTLHSRYTIRSVTYRGEGTADSTIHLRANVLRGNTFIEAGDYYSAEALQNTYNHFGRLGAVKYTNISFTEDADSAALDCDIQISTNKPSTISFQPEGTNTAGDLGAAATLTFQTRNLFHGSEMLSIELRGAYEAIEGLEGYSNEDFIEYGAEARLVFPRFIAPFLSRKFRRRMTATSEVSISYDLQDRPEYHRRVLSAAWRYKWSDANHHDKYQIDLLDLNYVSMPWISDTFREDYLENVSSRNAILTYNYEDLFIMKFGFGFTYNNGRYAVKTYVETAGNLLYGYSHLAGSSKNSSGLYEAFGIAYAQYAKLDFEYTRNWHIDYANTLVFHFGFGIAYPYGNSTILPFEKRYFSGGANSVRGWNVRELGPGKYVEKDGNINFINQTGDMKIDLNVEYRANLFWKFSGALFIDAGNVWTLRYYEDQDGGQFHFRDFLKEMAASYGFGLRLNFDYFVLRFDFGIKAVNPVYETSKEHYPIVHPDLSRDMTFHFAVGLPF